MKHKLIFMKPRIYFFILVIIIISCNQQNSQKELTGTWINTEKNKFNNDYLKFKLNNKLEIKHQKSKYDGNQFNEFKNLEEMYRKTIINLDYFIDSIDVNNGIYYTISNDSFSERRFALVDYPYLVNCGVKPKPKDRSYLYAPQIYISDEVNSSLITPNYHNYDFIIPDTLEYGEINIYFNNQLNKSQIKTIDKQIILNHLGVIDVDECFDPRYLVFEKYRAFIKKDNKLLSIPFFYKNVYWGHDSTNDEKIKAKKQFIKSRCPDDTSKCLIFSNLNNGRRYFLKNYNRKLEGGDVISLTYTTRKLLFKEYDRLYYGE